MPLLTMLMPIRTSDLLARRDRQEVAEKDGAACPQLSPRRWLFVLPVYFKSDL